MIEEETPQETREQEAFAIVEETDGNKDTGNDKEEETPYSRWFKRHNRYPKIPLNEIKGFLDGKEHLDIYQLFAFRIMTNPNPLKTIEILLNEANENYEIPKGEWVAAEFKNYWSQLTKFIICILGSWISIIALYFNIYNMTQESERGWCSMNGSIPSKLTAIIYTILVSTCFSSLLHENQHSGFYWQLAENYLGAFPSAQYNFISAPLLGFGKYMNLIVILNAFYLSIFIIYWSDDPIDIILNAVALLFIADIDNLLVTSFDYELLYDWFDNIGNQYYCDILPMKKAQKNFWRFCDIFGKIAVLITRFLMFVSPVWVAVCY